MLGQRCMGYIHTHRDREDIQHKWQILHDIVHENMKT